MNIDTLFQTQQALTTRPAVDHKQLVEYVKHKMSEFVGRPHNGVMMNVDDYMYDETLIEARDRITEALWPSWYGKNPVGINFLVSMLSHRGSGLHDRFAVVSKNEATKMNLLINGDQVTFNEFIFDASVVGHKGQRAPGRMVDMVRRTRQSSLQHRGQGVALPMDFMFDPIKMEIFRSYMKQMSTNVDETCLFSLMERLTSAGTRAYFDHFELPLELHQLTDIIMKQNDSFAALHKVGAGLRGLESQAYTSMADRNVLPDTVIAPRGSSHLLGAVHENQRLYKAAGPEMNHLTVTTADEKQSLVPCLKTPTYGWDVHMSKRFRLENQMTHQDPLTHTAWVSQRFLMTGDCADYRSYKSFHRDIRILNGDRGRFVCLTLWDAIHNCGLYSESGRLTQNGTKVLETIGGITLEDLAKAANMEQQIRDAIQRNVEAKQGQGGQGQGPSKRRKLPAPSTALDRFLFNGRLDADVPTYHAKLTKYMVGSRNGNSMKLHGDIDSGVWFDAVEVNNWDGKTGDNLIIYEQLVDGFDVMNVSAGKTRTDIFIGLDAKAKPMVTIVDLSDKKDLSPVQVAITELTAIVGPCAERHLRLLTICTSVATEPTLKAIIDAKYPKMKEYGDYVLRILYALSLLNETWGNLSPAARSALVRGLCMDGNPTSVSVTAMVSGGSTAQANVEDLVNQRMKVNFHRISEWEHLIQEDIPIPLDFILFRPYVRFQASCTLFLKSGSETAVTIMDRASLAYTDCADRFTVYANIRFDLGTVVRNPRNLHFFPDTFVSGYVGGAGHKFFSPHNGPREDQTDCHMFCMAISPQKQPISPWTSLTGTLHPDLGAVSDTYGGYDTSDAYRKIWDWSEANCHFLSMEYYYQAEQSDVSICTQSGQFTYNPGTSAIDKAVPGKCPLGDWPAEDTFDVLRSARSFNGHGIRGGMNQPIHRLLPPN
jgi:hypothetical protein